MLIVLNSILHMCVDGVCAFAMVGYFKTQPHWYLNILLYNFCAFALQMPFGFLVDFLEKKYRSRFIPYFVTAAGVGLTLIGALTHPIVLGIGNALFHIGGGACTIKEDLAGGKKGRLLGIFVAPGAFGLYLGKKYGAVAKTLNLPVIIIAVLAAAALLVLLYLAYAGSRLDKDYVHGSIGTEHPEALGAISGTDRYGYAVLALCFLVVIIRSYITMSMNFDWNTTGTYGLLLVLAAVFGKMSGGIWASLCRIKTTVAASLLLSALFFAFGNIPAMGILAMFFFNMTMPITLYELVITFRGLEYGMFGVLTFALFLGFVPVYLQWGGSAGIWSGAAAGLVSMILLLAADRIRRRHCCADN